MTLLLPRPLPLTRSAFLAAVTLLAASLSGQVMAQARMPEGAHDMGNMQMGPSTMEDMPGMDHGVMAMPLESSSPSDGETVKGSPASLSLTLPHPMVFQSVVLKTGKGQRLPLPSALPATAVKSVTLPLRPLPAGQYRVEWKAVSEHQMTGSFSFTVQ